MKLREKTNYFFHYHIDAKLDYPCFEKVTVGGFNLTSYRESLTKWNQVISHMYAQCIEVGSEACLPVHYEQLVLHPEAKIKINYV